VVGPDEGVDEPQPAAARTSASTGYNFLRAERRAPWPLLDLRQDAPSAFPAGFPFASSGRPGS